MAESAPEWTKKRRGRPAASAARVEVGLARGMQHMGGGLGGGFAVGDAVFAPKRRRTKGMHYALAEITGIQACAASATVAFVNAEPGVDDEAVPLYTLLPCRREAITADEDAAKDANICSLVRRALCAAAHDGPTRLSEKRRRWVTCDSCPGSDTESAPASITPSAPQVTFTPTPSPPAIMDEVGNKVKHENEVELEEEKQKEAGGWYTLQIFYAPPESVDRFYGRAFGAICDKILSRPSSQLPKVVLCIFEEYHSLHRFDVYMTLRGHRVNLIDGADPRTTRVAANGGASQSAPDALWLCLLAEDVEDEGAAVDLLKDWLHPNPHHQQQQSGGDSGGAPFSLAVAQFNEGQMATLSREGRGTEDLREPPGEEEGGSSGGAAAAADRLLAFVGGDAALIKCQLFRGAKDDELVATSLMADGGPRIPPTGWQEQKQPQLEFHGRRCQATRLELCIPASKWQLELIRSMLTRNKLEEQNGVVPRSRLLRTVECGELAFSNVPLAPTLLQAVANGNAFDTAMSSVLASSPSGSQLLGSIQERVMRSGSFLGDEAFPVLAAVRAILEDALPTPSAGRNSSQRRVALIIPGAAAATNDAATYRHAIQRFLYAWHLFTLTTTDRQRPGVPAVLDSLSWLETGGVLLLSPEAPLSRASSLHEEADIAIACGKAASAFMEASPGVPYVSLLSEVEVADGPAYPWILWPAAGSEAKPSAAERAILGKMVAATGRTREGAPLAQTS
ncbi:putative trans-sialidase, partial [Trypanosoma grayi]|uniref:putative trans-sialidase n=1 Tax=Trypanosoma grayi TaxID=71804 RepID=UPI0004F48594